MYFRCCAYGSLWEIVVSTLWWRIYSASGLRKLPLFSLVTINLPALWLPNLKSHVGLS